jgi:hypothetical protein
MTSGHDSVSIVCTSSALTTRALAHDFLNTHLRTHLHLRRFTFTFFGPSSSSDLGDVDTPNKDKTHTQQTSPQKPRQCRTKILILKRKQARAI